MEDVKLSGITEEIIQEDLSKETIDRKISLLDGFHFGRKKICIPLDKTMLNKENITKYLPNIINEHESNCLQYDGLYRFYKGNQPILRKQRVYNNNLENTIVLENHAFSMVEFKKAYQYGDGVVLSVDSESECPKELNLFSKVLKSCNFNSKNINLAECLYICGVARRIILPLTKEEKKSRMKTYRPFRIDNLEFDESFVVYSSGIGKDKLFGGVITKKLSTDINENKYDLTIYTDEKIMSYEYISMGNAYFISERENPIGICNVVEYSLNKSQLGIIEIIETILNSINIISSNSVDNVVDFVNSLLVFYNQEVDIKRLKELLSAGAVEIRTTDPSRQADVKYLVNALNQADVNTKYETLVTVAYDIVGVPRASGNVTSGGDTGQARLLGGGWTRSDTVAKQDEKSIVQGINEELEVMFSICDKDPYCEIKGLYSEDIRVSFSRSHSDNLLVKTQSLQNLNKMNFPKEAALNVVNIVSDVHEIAGQWQQEENEATNKIKKEKDNEAILKNEKEENLPNY